MTHAAGMQEDDQNPSVTLRAVVSEDEEFLLTVYSSTRADEMARVTWSEAQREAFLKMQFSAQQQHYLANNPNATHEIILLNGQPIGRLYVARREEEIRILDITILLPHRNRGIGTPLVRNLMNEAAACAKPLTIYVESFNPSLRLFERLRFMMKEQDGINRLMAWRAG